MQSALTTVSKNKIQFIAVLIPNARLALLKFLCQIARIHALETRNNTGKGIDSVTNYRHYRYRGFPAGESKSLRALWSTKKSEETWEIYFLSEDLRESLFRGAAFCRMEEQLLLSASEFLEKYIGAEMGPSVLSARDFSRRNRRRKCRWSSIRLPQVDF